MAHLLMVQSENPAAKMLTVNRAYKYRIYPSKRQQQTLGSHLEICRELYNAGLQERKEAWERARKTISYFDQSFQLKDIRPDRPDVASINTKVLSNVLKRVDWAFQGFFRRVKRGQRAGYPRFRSARRYNSITFREIGNALIGNKLRLSKIGNVRIKLHRTFVGNIKTLTITREANRWFAVFTVEIEAQPMTFSPNMIGVDVGLSAFATLSNGVVIHNPRWFRNAEAKLRRLQRRVARRKKGSNRRRKAVLFFARFHNHVRDQRRDFHHKESRKIVNANGLIAVENLNVKGMARNPKFAKSIHDAGWSSFIFMLTYKAEEAGRLLVKVDPRGTSQTCLCGASVPKPLKQREHVCKKCGLVGDRDHISAQLILARSAPSGANVDDLMSHVA